MNLLTEPLLRVQTSAGEERLALPGLLASLGRDGVEYITGIQRHQADAFHVFLSSLAAAVLVRQEETDPRQTEDFWRHGLRQLSEGAGDDPWTLVVDDLSRPAFMQPPLPSSDHAKLKPIEPLPSSADALDLLPTAKNHDIKRARADAPHPDHWVYALVSLQTMSGFFGRGNPGISRMNSGFGNRAIVELVRSSRPGIRWQDAVSRLLVYREEVLAAPFGYDARGLVLLWLRPWDGETSLPLSELDPFYIEICRRVRLGATKGAITAAAVPSTANRIAASELRGIVGDPWLPVDTGDGGAGSADQDKAMTVSPQGLTADLMRRLVFSNVGDGFRTTRLQHPEPGWRGPLNLHVSVLVRGQGTTDGFHERTVPIPPQAQRRLFGAAAEKEPWAALAKTGIAYAGTMQRSVLRPAVYVYLQGAPDKIQYDDDTGRWWAPLARRFDALWSADYFPWLWSLPEPLDEEHALQAWAERLHAHGLDTLRTAHRTLPVRTGRRWHSRIASEGTFWGALYRQFPLLERRFPRHETVTTPLE